MKHRLTIVFAFGALISVVTAFAWYLSRPLPIVDLPRERINDRFISEIAFDENGELKEWHASILEKFGENETDVTEDQHDEVYRLILLPTFDRPVMILCHREKGKQVMIVKQLNGEGGFGVDAMGKQIAKKEIKLSEEQWNWIAHKIESSGFWYKPSVDRNDEPLSDGAYWIFTGRHETTAHKISRITPDHELLDTFVYFLELGGVKKEYEGYF